MKKSEFKKQLFDLLDAPVDNLNKYEKLDLARNLLVVYQKEREEKEEMPNRGKPWTDEQIEIILSAAPTKENCARFARLFGRGYGSIEQIYRWAATPTEKLEEKGRREDAFLQQIKRIAKKIGFRA